MTAPAHVPVMLEAVLEVLAVRPGALIIDATFGAGGYSRALLELGARVIAFDRDPAAAVLAEPLVAAVGERLRFVRGRFSELERGLREADAGAPAAVVFDIGVSSMQLDEADRGFSFMRDGPLDMRMSATGTSAADLVNAAPVEELARIFRDYGEERRARHVANVLVGRRESRAFERTLDLADTVARALGGRRGAPTHPATRVFQALRIAVNDELGELEAGLAAAERVLVEGGRLVVVTFHSLEDRVVKSFLAARAGRTPSGSRHLPPTPLGAAASFTLAFNGAQAASEAEATQNPRARSAKLRAAVRTSAPPWREAA